MDILGVFSLGRMGGMRLLSSFPLFFFFLLLRLVVADEREWARLLALSFVLVGFD